MQISLLLPILKWDVDTLLQLAQYLGSEGIIVLARQIMPFFKIRTMNLNMFLINVDNSFF